MPKSPPPNPPHREGQEFLGWGSYRYGLFMLRTGWYPIYRDSTPRWVYRQCGFTWISVNYARVQCQLEAGHRYRHQWVGDEGWSYVTVSHEDSAHGAYWRATGV